MSAVCELLIIVQKWNILHNQVLCQKGHPYMYLSNVRKRDIITSLAHNTKTFAVNYICTCKNAWGKAFKATILPVCVYFQNNQHVPHEDVF